MARNQNFTGSIEVLSGLKPAGKGQFPLIEAEDVLMPDGRRLSNVPLGGGGGSPSEAVLYIQQDLDSDQQAQARRNISAIALTDLPEQIEDIVRYDTAQDLTNEQQEQARTNIGATSQAYVDSTFVKSINNKYKPDEYGNVQIDIGGGSTNTPLLVVTLSGEGETQQASHTSTQIYDHLSSGGTVVLHDTNHVVYNVTLAASADLIRFSTLSAEVGGATDWEIYDNGIASQLFVQFVEIEQLVEQISPLVEITYDELKTLRDDAQLIPGRQYRIIDYITTTSQENTKSAKHQFDIIVTADDNNILNENAKAIQHKGNTYFANSNLAAWELKYSLDNDVNKYAWGDIIQVYEDKDVDFIWRTKNINGDTSVSFNILSSERDLYNMENNTDPDDFTNLFASDKFTPDEVFYSCKASDFPDSNIYLTTQIIDDEAWNDGSYIEIQINGETVGTYSYKGDNGLSRTPVVELILDSYSAGCGVIYYMKDEYNNECSYDFKNIQFLRTEDIYSEVDTSIALFGDQYFYTFSWVNENLVIEDLSLLGNNILQNDEGQISGCVSNKIPSISAGQSNYEVVSSLSEQFALALNNIVFISSYTYDNSAYYGCNNNNFENDCYNNTFGNSCYNNSFGNYCCNNILGNNCYNNTFGNDCQNNTFGYDCYYNTFGNNCRDNSVGNYCYNNTFGNECQDVIFKNGKLLINYCRFIVFDSGCRYITLSTSSANAIPQNYLQNIKVCLGVAGQSSANPKTLMVDRNLPYETTFMVKESTAIYV